jgi:hypothetical protein
METCRPLGHRTHWEALQFVEDARQNLLYLRTADSPADEIEIEQGNSPQLS